MYGKSKMVTAYRIRLYAKQNLAPVQINVCRLLCLQYNCPVDSIYGTAQAVHVELLLLYMHVVKYYILCSDKSF